MFKTGVIYHFTPCRASEPVKNKYAVCVSGQNSWFCLINSCSDVFPVRPYPHEEGQVVFFKNFQNETLKRHSYINVSKMTIITERHFDHYKAYQKISPMVWINIKRVVGESNRLPKQQKDVIKSEKI